MSTDSLGVGINQPFREVLGPVRLYIYVDPLHFDIVWSTVVANSVA